MAPDEAMTRTERPASQFFLAYLTANDSPYYVADFLNFRAMTLRHPGVERIALYIAVSRVRPWSARDYAAVDALARLAAGCPWLDVRAVLWKGNVGRDFSSAEACLQALGAEASPDDFVMVRNRSAYGPSRPDWYRQYVEQYRRVPDTALVGSTINLIGHPKRPSPGPATHVQTYAYLSQWRHFATLADAYPAARCVDRIELIDQGEIGLSRHLLDRGLGISCLRWPDQHFTRDRPAPERLPRSDIKSSALDLSLRYKYRRYFLQARNVPAQLAWLARLKLADHRPHAALRTVRQVSLSQYG
jgi:hypothetical protein